MESILPFSLSEMVLAFFAVGAAYVVFGIAGFGTALIASPILANFMPVSKIVPLLALLDMFAAFGNVVRDGRKASVPELKRLVPCMIVGSTVGAFMLLKARPDFLLLALAVFVVAYSLYSLSGFRSDRRFSSSLSVLFGLIGGVFSALFGSGGFIYAIYLSGRLEQKESFRVTQATLIGLSTLTRVAFFVVSGVYMDSSLLVTAMMLAPAMLFGVVMGRRMTLRLTREQFIRIVNIVIFLSGVFLMIRYFAG